MYAWERERERVHITFPKSSTYETDAFEILLKKW